MTQKQKLQKDRAYFKMVISGLPKPISLDSLTDSERLSWLQIMETRRILLENFDTHSRAMGLKVPEYRCWCGKEGKYIPAYDTGIYTTKVCKKHIEPTYE